MNTHHFTSAPAPRPRGTPQIRIKSARSIRLSQTAKKAGRDAFAYAGQCGRIRVSTFLAETRSPPPHPPPARFRHTAPPLAARKPHRLRRGKPTAPDTTIPALATSLLYECVHPPALPLCSKSARLACFV
jgi:hypothetical protein